LNFIRTKENTACCEPGCCSPQIEKEKDCCSPECCSSEKENQPEKIKIILDFLFLDLGVCTRCQGADNSVDEAIDEVSKVLETTGIGLEINKIHIDNMEKAEKFKFKSSPTIRINGQDIQLEVKESVCESCGDLCGDEVDCRVWIYQGKEYNVPPKGMIIGAILREIYSGRSILKEDEEKDFRLPKNLVKFFTSKEKQK